MTNEYVPASRVLAAFPLDASVVLKASFLLTMPSSLEWVPCAPASAEAVGARTVSRAAAATATAI
jgi:hypothetical protein